MTEEQVESVPKKSFIKRFKWLSIVLVVIVLIGLLGWGSYPWLKNRKSVSTISTPTATDLKFDQSASKSDPFNDPNGPFYHKVYKDISPDGLNYTGKGELVIDKASVPDVVKTNDGKLYIYAVDGGNRSNSGAMVAVSSDNGTTWRQGSVQIKSEDEEMSVADPQAVLQDDGSIRLFYLTATGLPDKKNGVPVNMNQGTYMIKSAHSQDGINFIEEKGIRYQSVGEQITDPDVIKINNKWYMYLAKGSELIATVSTDGNAFTFLQSIRKDGSVSKTVPLDNNQFRQYFCRNGISSATSVDGLNWTDDPGIRIKQANNETVCDPSPVKIDNTWLMIYKVEPAQKNVNNDSQK